MFERNLGDLGENLLRTWCSQVGIDTTPPEKDRRGWDFLLELPLEIDESIPLDHQPSRLRCWVQVKATDKQTKNRRVKLSNWANLAKSLEPSFFLVCEFDGQTNCQKAYLVHIGENYIQRTLMALRKLGTKNHGNQNKIKLPFVYSEDDRLPSLDGKGLIEAIKKHVNQMEDYVSWKKKLIENLGYEEGGHQMNVTFELPNSQKDGLEHLVDLSIGLIPHIETTRVELKDVRFGVEAPELTQVFERKGILKMPNLEPVEQGTLVFYTEDFSKEVRLNAEIYIPQGFAPELLQNNEKIRFALPFCDFIMTGNIWKFDLKWPNVNKKYKLKELYSIAQVFLLFQKAKSEQLDILNEVFIKDKIMKGSGSSSEFVCPEEVIKQAQLIEIAWVVAKHFDIQESLSVSIAELLNQKLLPIAFQILSKERPIFQVKYWLGKTETHKGREIYVAHVIHVALGKYILFFLITASGKSHKTSSEMEDASEWRFKTRGVDLTKTWLLNKRDLDKFEDIIRGLLNWAITNSPEKAIVILSDDAKELLGISEIIDKLN